MGINYKSADLITSVNEIISLAKERGIIHLRTEDKYFNGKDITIKGKNLINFGSCSYLGLEVEDHLKESAIDAVRRYGTQFSSSQT
jgi:7-keto-8-aminopelargonate synthetase-like enzyme